MTIAIDISGNIIKYTDQLVHATEYDQDGVTFYGPSLLWQLKMAISNASGTGERGNGGKKKIVISTDAFDMMRKVKSDYSLHLFGEDWESCFRWWRMKAKTVPERTNLMDKLSMTIGQIKNLLDPPHRYHLDFACPHCHARMVLVADETGEMVQRAALTVNGVDGCVCLSCRSVWPPDRLESLAHVLGCEPL